jgi:hypothetical protein
MVFLLILYLSISQVFYLIFLLNNLRKNQVFYLSMVKSNSEF